MSFSMFPNAPASAGPKPYIQIKAGKCAMEQQAGSSNNYNVTPILKKGSLNLVKGTDGLTHFQWVERPSNAVVDDFMVFPGDAVLSKVNTGCDKDRVYLLKWQGGASRKFMFWMQEKSTEEDAENCRKFNEYITTPPAEEAGSGAPAAASGQAADLMRLLGRAPPAPAAGAPARAPAPSNSIGGFDFSQLLSGAASMPPRPPASNAAAPSSTPGNAMNAQDFQNAMMGAAANAEHTDLSEVLRPDQVIGSGVLNNPDVVADLIPHLPEGQQSAEHLEQAIRSPQFQQAVGELGSAVEQDPSGAVISNVGLAPPAGGVNLHDPVSSFLDAVQASAPSEATSDPTGTQGDGFVTPARPQEEKKDDEAESDRMDESA